VVQYPDGAEVDLDEAVGFEFCQIAVQRLARYAQQVCGFGLR